MNRYYAVVFLHYRNVYNWIQECLRQHPGQSERVPNWSKTTCGEGRICIAHYNDVIMGTMASQITSLTIVYSNFYSGADQRKHQSSASLAFVWGIHRGPVNSPHKWPVTRKMFPFDDVIMTWAVGMKFVAIAIPIVRCIEWTECGNLTTVRARRPTTTAFSSCQVSTIPRLLHHRTAHLEIGSELSGKILSVHNLGLFTWNCYAWRIWVSLNISVTCPEYQPCYTIYCDAMICPIHMRYHKPLCALS